MAIATVTAYKASYNGDSITDEETITTDGAQITNVAKSSNLMILVCNTDASDDMTVTVSAGDKTGSGIGDLTVTVGEATKHWIGPVESHRFADSDGYIQMDFSSTGTLAGTVLAVELP